MLIVKLGKFGNPLSYFRFPVAASEELVNIVKNQEVFELGDGARSLVVHQTLDYSAELVVLNEDLAAFVQVNCYQGAKVLMLNLIH